MSARAQTVKSNLKARGETLAARAQARATNTMSSLHAAGRQALITGRNPYRCPIVPAGSQK